MMSPTQHQKIEKAAAESEDGYIGVEEDPDKENHFTVSSTQRASPNNEVSSIISPLQAPAYESSSSTTSSRPRYSFVGPLASDSLRKEQFSQSSTIPTIRHTALTSRKQPDSDSSAETESATSHVRLIGRSVQQFFLHGRRRSVGSASITSFSSPSRQSTTDTGDMSSSTISLARGSKTRSSGYKKRNPIYMKEHKDAVKTFNSNNLRRIANNALARINVVRRGKRLPAVSAEQMEGLAIKNLAVKKLVDAENRRGARIASTPSDTSRGQEMERMFQRMMRQKEADAQSVLPLPPAKLVEMERLKREQRARLKKLRGVLSRPPLPKSLEEEADREVDTALRKPGLVAAITGAEVNDRDLQKLRPGQWLNDEIINFYGNLMLQRANDADSKRQAALKAAADAPPAQTSEDSKAGAAAAVNGKVKSNYKTVAKPKRPYDSSLDAYWRIHFFSSFFWENLKNRGYDGVKRWTRKIDIFSKDLILFPINLGNAHWVCGAVNMRFRRFEYYDSMGHRNGRAFELMRTYVSSEARDKQKKEIDLRSWRDVFSEETPQQENGYDCGVFATQTLEQISRRDPHTPIPLHPPTITWKTDDLDQQARQLTLDKANGETPDEDDVDDQWDDYDWNFSQLDMPYLRRRMIYEIHRKSLIGV